MLTAVRQIGNSRGVLIPAAFLASCQIDDQADMQLQDGQIVIKPAQRQLRKDWFTPSAQTALPQDTKEAGLWADAPLADDSEWVW